MEECVKREVYEETGLIIDEFKLFDVFSNPTRIVQYADGNILRIITMAYIVQIESDVELRCSNESIQLRYFTLEELDKVDLADTHKDIRQRYIDKKLEQCS